MTCVGSIKEAWESARTRAAKMAPTLGAVRLHDCRHTFCTRLLGKGASLPLLATIMGWSGSTLVLMARRYGHFKDSDKRAAVERLDAPMTVPPTVEQTVGTSSAPQPAVLVH